MLKVLESMNYIVYSHDGINFQVDLFVEEVNECVVVACYNNINDAIEFVKNKIVSQLRKINNVCKIKKVSLLVNLANDKACSVGEFINAVTIANKLLNVK